MRHEKQALTDPVTLRTVSRGVRIKGMEKGPSLKPMYDNAVPTPLLFNSQEAFVVNLLELSVYSVCV